MILVVDDERCLAATLGPMLELVGQRSTAVSSAEEALRILRSQQPSLIISDVILPGANGVELAIEARRLWPNVPILLISGNLATQELMEAARRDGHHFELLAKPVPPKQFLTKVASLLGHGPKLQPRQLDGGKPIPPNHG